MEVLKQENGDLSKELSKVTQLLTLQKDIDRENKVYFDQRTKQCQLLEAQARAKLEDLARQYDLLSAERFNAQMELK